MDWKTPCITGEKSRCTGEKSRKSTKIAVRLTYEGIWHLYSLDIGLYAATP